MNYVNQRIIKIVRSLELTLPFTIFEQKQNEIEHSHDGAEILFTTIRALNKHQFSILIYRHSYFIWDSLYYVQSTQNNQLNVKPY